MFKDLPYGITHSFNDGCGEPEHNADSQFQNWENDFLEILPIIKSNLTLDAKVARIKTIVEKLLTQAEVAGKAYWEPSDFHKEKWREESYKKGFIAGKAEMYETLRDVVMKQRKEQYDLGYLHGIEAENERWINQPANEHDNKLRAKIKADLLKIADEGEYEDLRREIETYFK